MIKRNDTAEYVAVQFLQEVRKCLRAGGMTPAAANESVVQVAYAATSTRIVHQATYMLDGWMSEEGIARWYFSDDTEEVIIAIDNVLGKHDRVFPEEVEVLATF